MRSESIFIERARRATAVDRIAAGQGAKVLDGSATASMI